MIYQVVEEKEVFAEKTALPVNILVVGVGGGGSNAVDSMIKSGIRGVDFLAVNTDIDALRKSHAINKLQIGVNTTEGRGAGGMPDRGEQAALEDEARIKDALKETNMVFIIAGMGGGTGTGAAPVIARISRSLGALTVGVVTKPFEHELIQRMRQAEEGIERLREEVDTLIIIPNEKIFNIIDRKTGIREAFSKANEVLSQGVKGISDIIVETGDINIDFADAETVMKDQGEALMTIGYGEGEDRVAIAAAAAIDNPLLEETSIKGATKLLVYVSAGEDFSMVEYKEAINMITGDINPDAHVIAGMYINPELRDKIRITVIATGFPRESKYNQRPAFEVVRPEGDSISANDYQDILGKTQTKPRSEFLSRRGHALAGEDQLDIPTAIRYPSPSYSGDDSVSGYAFAGKAAENRIPEPKFFPHAAGNGTN